jgi:manganese/iron transport system permease protein
MEAILAPFQPEFMRLALAEVLLLSVPAGLLGAQIVLRRLAFFTHGVGAAAFPGLVLAGPLGVPPQAAALATGMAFAGGLNRLRGAARLTADAATGLLLVSALALGIVLASDAFASGAGVDQLLFGTLLGISPADLVVTAVAVAVVAGAHVVASRAWIAAGFDPQSAPTLELPVRGAEPLLLVVVAVAVVAAVDAAGALLVGALLVIPAATVRLFARSVRELRLGAVALAAVEGAAGLWAAYRLDVPPGPAIAVLAGALFAAAAAARWAAGAGRGRGRAHA